MLRTWGLAQRLRGKAELKLSKRRVRIGETIELRLQLVSTSPRVQKLAIDYVVHHVKANGQTTPKVFKAWVIELGPLESRGLRKSHSMKAVTTRVYYPGRHAIELRINGANEGRVDFELRH